MQSKALVLASTALGAALVVTSGCGHRAASDGDARSNGRSADSTTCVSTTSISGPGLLGAGPVAINARGQVTGNGTWASAGGSTQHAFFWDGQTASDLGTLGGTTSLPWAMNDNGWVAGQSLTGGADNETHATLWHDGTVVDLGTLGGNWSVARSINNAGQIVGPSTIASDGLHMHAFLWESGVMKDLGTLGGSDSNAAQIDDRGQILGWSTLPDGSQHSFLWDNGVMTDLGTFGGFMNQRGDIAGMDGTKMYLRLSDGTRIEIVPFAGATSSTIVARDDRGNTLNEVGQVIGLTRRADGSRVSFVWQEGATTQTIGPVDSAFAVGINNSAQVAGYVVDGSAVNLPNGGVAPPPTRAFSWKDGELTYLAPADQRTDVIAINDRGQIAGVTPTGPVIWETSPCGTTDGGSSGGNESDAGGSSSSGGGSSSGGSSSGGGDDGGTGGGGKSW